MGIAAPAVTAAAASGPGWTDILTAIGTVGAVVAAVGIALWTEYRSGRRLAAEHERSDRQLEAERKRSSAEIEDERRIARDREQLAEAHAVRVVHVWTPAGPQEKPREARRLAAIVTNHGAYTITRLEARFSYDGKSLTTHRKYKRESGVDDIDESLRKRWWESDEEAAYGILTPQGSGVFRECLHLS